MTDTEILAYLEDRFREGMDVRFRYMDHANVPFYAELPGFAFLVTPTQTLRECIIAGIEKQVAARVVAKLK